MSKVYAKAVALLAGREHSAKELETKLLQKGFADEEATDALAQLQAAGLQSDQRFTESFVRSWANKGRGWIRIRADLQQHDIAAEIIADVLAEAEIDWGEIIHTVWQKKFGTYAKTTQEKAKQIRFLQQRGFEMDLIRQVIEG